jgi:hypothetical protein
MSIVGHPKVTKRAYEQPHHLRERATRFAEACVYNGLRDEASALSISCLSRLKYQIERDFLVELMKHEESK